MIAKRIIPCLDVKDRRVVKGTNFINLQDAGDAVELAYRYYQEGADELVFLGRDLVMEKNYSEKVAEEIDSEVRKMINGAHETAKKLIVKKRRFLDKIAKRLIAIAFVQNDFTF